MVSIALVNQKGGVSKTASTANLAAIYAGKYHKKVLAVDCDAQANLTFYLAGETAENHQFTEALLNRLDPETQEVKKGKDEEEQQMLDRFDDLKQCMIPISYKWKGKDVNLPLSLIPASSKLDYITNADINLLNNFLDSVSNEYDICLIDCGPERMPYNMLAIAAADYIIVPMDPMLVNIHGLDLINTFVSSINNMAHTNVSIMGAFLTMVDSRRVIDQQVSAQLYSNYGNLMFKSTIRYATALKESYNLATPLYFYERSQNVCEDYINLAVEIMKKLREKGEKI